MVESKENECCEKLYKLILHIVFAKYIAKVPKIIHIVKFRLFAPNFVLLPKIFNLMNEITNEITAEANQIQRRRTFAIISHPDAGKTTLTEKLLLFGGAIHVAGAVKSTKSVKQRLLTGWKSKNNAASQ